MASVPLPHNATNEEIIVEIKKVQRQHFIVVCVGVLTGLVMVTLIFVSMLFN